MLWSKDAILAFTIQVSYYFVILAFLLKNVFTGREFVRLSKIRSDLKMLNPVKLILVF